MFSMYCGNCGSRIPNDAQFCQSCGFHVGKYQQPKPASEQVQSTNVSNQDQILPEKRMPMAALISMLVLSLFCLIGTIFSFNRSDSSLKALMIGLLILGIYMTVVLAKNNRGIPLTIGNVCFAGIGLYMTITIARFDYLLLVYQILPMALLLAVPSVLLILLQYGRAFRRVWVLPGILGLLFWVCIAVFYSVAAIFVLPLAIYFFSCADWLASPSTKITTGNKQVAVPENTVNGSSSYKLSGAYKIATIIVFIALGIFPFLPITNGKVACGRHDTDYVRCPQERSVINESLFNEVGHMSGYVDHMVAMNIKDDREKIENNIKTSKDLTFVGMVMCMTIPLIFAFSIIAFLAKTQYSPRRDLKIISLSIAGWCGTCVGLLLFLISKSQFDGYISKYAELYIMTDLLDITGIVLLFCVFGLIVACFLHSHAKRIIYPQETKLKF